MKIAITGTIGSGKTTVCDYLRSKGYYVFDCDEYNRYLLEEGNKGYLLVKKEFPTCFKGNVLDKKRLSNIVFNDISKKEKLESLLHPLIQEEMLKKANDYDLYFAEVPLLFESGMDVLFDETLLIVVYKEIALKRLEERGIEKEEALKRIENQMDVQNKMKRATEIIYNNSTLKDLEIAVDKWLEKYAR